MSESSRVLARIVSGSGDHGPDSSDTLPQPHGTSLQSRCHHTQAMTPRSLLLHGLLGLASLACACSPTQGRSPRAPILPLQSVRLYETGVGYFERAGAIDSAGATSLPVPSGHLDDALKTLVVLGAGDTARTRVHGIEWSSSLSHGMARAVAGLPAESDKPTRLQELLVGLKGARVRAETARGVVVGRLVDFSEEGAAADAGTKPAADPRLALLILSDQGDIVRVDAATMTALRPLDPGYAARLGSALDALGSHVAESERLLHVLSAGGPVTLGYIAETPVWRTTYRLVVGGPSAGSKLQGWALVHNDTDEDWRGVRVSLANGRPDSFLFPLAAPRYSRRPLVTPDDELATVPQLMGETVDAIWGDRVGDAIGAGGLGLSGVGEGGGGHGAGIGLGSIGTIGHGSGTGPASSLLTVGNLAGVASAAGVQAGAQFIYSLPEAVDLHAHGSALLPFVDATVDARPITWVDGVNEKPRSAFKLVNSTSQTWPAGTIAFFEAGGFSGESGLDRLEPGERRFLTYGFDLDVALSVGTFHALEEPKRLLFDARSGQLEEHYLRTVDETYRLENRSTAPRTIVLKTGLSSNAKVTGADELDFDGAPLVLFKVAAATREERAVHTVEGLVRTTPIASLTSSALTDFAERPALDAGDKVPVGAAAAELRDAEADDKAKAGADADIASLTRDIDRLREHMRALGDHAALGNNPFAGRVLVAEDKLTALRAKHDAIEKSAVAHRAAARAELTKLASR